MANYKGTETEKNLWTAFAGESQARCGVKNLEDLVAESATQRKT